MAAPALFFSLPPRHPLLSSVRTQGPLPPIALGSKLHPWPSSPPFTAPTHERPLLLPLAVVHVRLKMTRWVYDRWSQVQVHLCFKLQIFALLSNIHISSFRAPKIVIFVLLDSLWNALTSGSICWYVLVEKLFYRNSYLKLVYKINKLASLHSFNYKNPKMMKLVLLVRCCHTLAKKNIKLICCSMFSWCVN
jgi:hypothetical protein